MQCDTLGILTLKNPRTFPTIGIPVMHLPMIVYEIASDDVLDNELLDVMVDIISSAGRFRTPLQ